jgi:hypothetical protein
VIARCFAFVGPDLPLNVHFPIGIFIPLRTYLKQTDLAHLVRDTLAPPATATCRISTKPSSSSASDMALDLNIKQSNGLV